MDTLVFDADDQIAGRLATRAAKEILKGKRVIIINAEKAVISGNPTYIINTYRAKVQKGDPYKGPFYPRTPDRLLRRIVRGMLPKRPRGRAAYRKLEVYKGKPAGLGLKDEAILRPIETSNTLEHKFITLGNLSRHIGGKG
ncbi:MAG: 50S ribosomal protein L13 [Candidatus Aenigmarchaeota archaeon]|nr:50S ribosomal protein L13 [Candidatus Aenigmarchaeota archaeon]